MLLCVHLVNFLGAAILRKHLSVVTKATTETCFLKMAAPNKLTKSLGNTCEGFVFLVKLQAVGLRFC